jgi:hypothetical protein
MPKTKKAFPIAREGFVDGTGVEVFNYEHCAGDALDGIEHLAKVAELGEKFLPKP